VGRCTINSVNYEDGAGPDSRFHETMELVAETRVAIAERIIEDITTNWGVDESSILRTA
jgi:5-methyltetrahydrofolate--homocysteine methyltransferase